MHGMQASASRDAPPFRGLGPAGGLWRTTLALLVLSGALLVGYVVTAMAGADWTPIAFFGFAWLFGAFALLAWGASLVAAAFRLGRLARPVLALGGIVCLAAAAVAAASLSVTGERVMVGLVMACGLAGAVASVVAWRRPPPPLSRDADPGEPTSPPSSLL